MVKCLSKRHLIALLFILVLILTLSHIFQFMNCTHQGGGDDGITVTQIKSVDMTNDKNSASLSRNLFQNIISAKSFNLGQVMRGTQDFNLDSTLTSEHIHRLRVKNKCPDQYNFPEDILAKFENIDQISNFSKTVNNSIKHDFSKKIVILSPVSNYEFNIFHYFKLLCSLSYPHELITVMLGEDSSKDKTYHVSSVHAKQLRPFFNNMTVHHFQENMPEQDYFGKHDEFYQMTRRSHLARVRNQMLFKGLSTVTADAVLWIDVDVKYVPPDIIQHLLTEDKDVIVPSCMFAKSSDGGLDIYDRNTWQETNTSRAYLKKLPDDQLKLEGYTHTMRKYLPNLKEQGYLVPLDGVGGCVLMIKADCHRKGLIFPTFVFNNHIETEGLAKMALKMKYGVYGLPFVNVVHW